VLEKSHSSDTTVAHGERGVRTPVEKPGVQATRVVALGIGDTGLPALKRFLLALSSGGGMTYVVVQHAGSPHAPSADPSVLEDFTDMPVLELQPGAALMPNRVYVAAPEIAVDLVGNELQPSKLAEPSERRTIVDRLFRSLAHGLGERAVGVVFPGSGHDGALGVQAIARAGGSTFAVESGKTHTLAGEESMPESAVATGCIDHVLTAFRTAQVLLAKPRLIPRARPTIPREQLELDNAELSRLNRQLFDIHGRLQETLTTLRARLDESDSRASSLLSGRAELANMLQGASIALLFLDEHQCLQGYCGDAANLYEIGPGYIGRPLSSLEHRAHDMPPVPTLEELRAATEPSEADVVTSERWYVRRILVPAPSAPRPLGIVLLFIDVTQLKHAAQPEEPWVRTLTDASPSVISYVDEAIARYLT
jgi:hypothetical protein